MTFENYIKDLCFWLLQDGSVVYMKKNILYAENFYHGQMSLLTMKENFDYMVEKYGQPISSKYPTLLLFQDGDIKHHLDFGSIGIKIGTSFKGYADVDSLKKDLDS